MCNPRRIRVLATRELAESWEQEVRRRVTRTGRATGTARVLEPLENTIGGPTLTALTAVLAHAVGWEQDAEGVFRHELDGGHIAYDPATRDLEIVARVSTEVSVTGEATDTVRAEVSGTVEAEGVGQYYDDEWGGVTQDDAQRIAEREADRSLEEQAESLRAQARRRADETVGEAVRRQAEQRAEVALTAASAAQEEELREQATERLTAVGIEGRNLFHQALATAYRDAILAYARARRADNIRSTETGGVVEIEFDLQI